MFSPGGIWKVALIGSSLRQERDERKMLNRE
jgi:hypothetical protein